MNNITTYIGRIQRPITLMLVFIIINPHVLDDFLSPAAQQYLMKGIAVIAAFIGYLKDTKTADAKTVTDLITAVPITPTDTKIPMIQLKTAASALVLLICFFLCSCAAFLKFQDNPANQAIEVGLFDVGANLMGQPELAFLAGPAVNGLTVITDATQKQNPTAINWSNVQAGSQQVATAVAQAIPTNNGKVAAQVAAAAYTSLMSSQNPPTPSAANIALKTIATALTNGSISQQ